MTPTDPFDPARLVLPVCRPTVERLQSVLDGELPAGSLDTDPHSTACAACRERVAAARLLVAILASAEPLSAPAGLTENILAAVKEDRFTRLRRRSYAISAGALVAIAATVLLVAWLTSPPPTSPRFLRETAKSTPTPTPETAPAPRPLRISDEFSKAGNALRDVPRSITDSTSAAPELFAAVSDAFTRPMTPMADMNPQSSTLIDIPDAARTGLEPVTDTAQKAFTRLMHEVGSVKPKS